MPALSWIPEATRAGCRSPVVLWWVFEGGNTTWGIVMSGCTKASLVYVIWLWKLWVAFATTVNKWQCSYCKLRYVVGGKEHSPAGKLLESYKHGVVCCKLAAVLRRRLGVRHAVIKVWRRKVANVAVICLCPVSFLAAAWGLYQPPTARWSSLNNSRLFFAFTIVLPHEGAFLTFLYPRAVQRDCPQY